MISRKHPISKSATYRTVDKLLDSRKLMVNYQSKDNKM